MGAPGGMHNRKRRKEYHGNEFLDEHRQHLGGIRAVLPARRGHDDAHRRDLDGGRLPDRLWRRHCADHPRRPKGAAGALVDHARGPVCARRICGGLSRHAHDGTGHVHLLRHGDAVEHPYGHAAGGAADRFHQYGRIHGRDRARRHPVDRRRPNRGRKGHRHDACADDAVCDSAAGAAQHHAADRQQPDHQYQGHLRALRDRYS